MTELAAFASDTMQVNKKNMSAIVNLVEELVINKVGIEKLKNETADIGQVKVLDQELRIISDIQDSIKKVGLIKFVIIHENLKNLVRQLNEKHGVEVDLKFEGLETEVENTIINSLHVMFASMIEDVFNSGHLQSGHNSYYIAISVNSDKKNLDVVFESNCACFNAAEICKRMKMDALELTGFKDEDAQSVLQELQFHQSLESFMELKAEMLYSGGSIRFDSKPEGPAMISISIPLISSIMQGMLINVGEQVFAIPTDFIESIVNSKSIKKQKSNKHEVVMYMDQVIQLINLTDLLEVPSTGELASIIIAFANQKRVALLVDSIQDQIDMVIKPKHSIMKDMAEYRGTTILGDGMVALVLDIPSIIKRT